MHEVVAVLAVRLDHEERGGVDGQPLRLAHVAEDEAGLLALVHARAGGLGLACKAAVRAEALHPQVLGVRHVEDVVGVCLDVGRRIELAGLAAGGGPLAAAVQRLGTGVVRAGVAAGGAGGLVATVVGHTGVRVRLVGEAAAHPAHVLAELPLAESVTGGGRPLVDAVLARLQHVDVAAPVHGDVGAAQRGLGQIQATDDQRRAVQGRVRVLLQRRDGGDVQHADLLLVGGEVGVVGGGAHVHAVEVQLVEEVPAGLADHALHLLAGDDLLLVVGRVAVGTGIAEIRIEAAESQSLAEARDHALEDDPEAAVVVDGELVPGPLVHAQAGIVVGRVGGGKERAHGEELPVLVPDGDARQHRQLAGDVRNLAAGLAAEKELVADVVAVVVADVDVGGLVDEVHRDHVAQVVGARRAGVGQADVLIEIGAALVGRRIDEALGEVAERADPGHLVAFPALAHRRDAEVLDEIRIQRRLEVAVLRQGLDAEVQRIVAPVDQVRVLAPQQYLHRFGGDGGRARRLRRGRRVGAGPLQRHHLGVLLGIVRGRLRDVAGGVRRLPLHEVAPAALLLRRRREKIAGVVLDHGCRVRQVHDPGPAEGEVLRREVDAVFRVTREARRRQQDGRLGIHHADALGQRRQHVVTAVQPALVRRQRLRSRAVGAAAALPGLPGDDALLVHRQQARVAGIGLSEERLAAVVHRLETGPEFVAYPAEAHAAEVRGLELDDLFLDGCTARLRVPQPGQVRVPDGEYLYAVVPRGDLRLALVPLGGADVLVRRGQAGVHRKLEQRGEARCGKVRALVLQREPGGRGLRNAALGIGGDGNEHRRQHEVQDRVHVHVRAPAEAVSALGELGVGHVAGEVLVLHRHCDIAGGVEHRRPAQVAPDVVQRVKGD